MSRLVNVTISELMNMNIQGVGRCSRSDWKFKQSATISSGVRSMPVAAEPLTLLAADIGQGTSVDL